MRTLKTPLLIITILLSGQIIGQNLTISAGTKWKDVDLLKNDGDASKASTNYPTFPKLTAFAWTNSGNNVYRRSLFHFDLSEIPTNATVTSARLKLYQDPTWATTNNGIGVHSSHTSSNAVYIEKVTGTWAETTVTWNSQPTTTTTGRISLGQTPGYYQNEDIDITTFAQGWVSSPSTNHGLMMKLQNETQYCARNYASEDNGSYLPKVEIWYTLPPVTLFTYAYGSTISGIDVADIDDNGTKDILLSSHSLGSNPYIRWYSNNGSESFTGYTALNISSAGLNAWKIIDLDGDTDEDILYVDVSNDQIKWLQNNGSETFTSYTVASSTTLRPTAGDLDSDGDIDIVAENFSDIYWYENNGSGSFTSHLINDDGAPQGSPGALDPIQIIDINSDGHKDLIFDKGIYGVQYLKNNGSQSFTLYLLSSWPYNSNQAVPVDMDGDSDIDILVSTGCSNCGNRLMWLENEGTDSNWSINGITDSYDMFSIVPVDIDNDGDMDIVSDTNGLGVFKNDGNEQFKFQHISTIGGSGAKFEVVDLDDDGDFDVVCPGNYSNGTFYLYWFKNQGSGYGEARLGSFAPEPIVLNTFQETFAPLVYPNPSNGTFFVNVSDSIQSSYKLFDIEGRLIKSDHLAPSVNEIKLGEKNKGLFFLEVSTDEKSSIKSVSKIIVK